MAAEEGEEGEMGMDIGLPGAVMGMESDVVSTATPAAPPDEEEASNAECVFKSEEEPRH